MALDAGGPVTRDELADLQTPEQLGAALRRTREHARIGLREMVRMAEQHRPKVLPPGSLIASDLTRDKISAMESGSRIVVDVGNGPQDDRLEFYLYLCGIGHPQRVPWLDAAWRVHNPDRGSRPASARALEQPMSERARPDGADAIIGAARAVGLLIDNARQLRCGPAEISAEWNRYRDRLTVSMAVFDADGNRVPVEPAARDTQRFVEAVVTELEATRVRLEPLASAVRGELHAMGASNATLSPWIRWIDEAVSEVVAASSVWPAPGYEGDDERLDTALNQLRRASGALAAAWRGEPAEEPPAPAPSATEPVETPTERALREHTEVLESARPWARVDHRAFDPALYQALVETAAVALHIPRVPTTLDIDLAATARLAAKVARNADEATFCALIKQAAISRPLAVAVELLSALGATARNSGREAAAADAVTRITQLLTDGDWADPAVWDDNAHHMQRLLGLTAANITDDNTVSATIAAALDNDRQLLFPILRAIVQSTVQLSRTGGPSVIKYGLDEVPSWLPVERVAAEIAEQLPDLRPAHDEDHDPYPDIEHNLAAHLLRIADHRPESADI
ncbi:hypothetical protein [Nocardia gipuzkoensis]